MNTATCLLWGILLPLGGWHSAVPLADASPEGRLEGGAANAWSGLEDWLEDGIFDGSADDPEAFDAELEAEAEAEELDFAWGAELSPTSVPEDTPWISDWRAAAGTAWSAGSAPLPFVDLAGQGGGAWDLQLRAGMEPPAEGVVPAPGGATATRVRRPAAMHGPWGAQQPLGSTWLRLHTAHLRGSWGNAQGVLGDYTAGFAEGLTLERTPRRAAAGWRLRPPARFVLSRGRWVSPAGWQGAAVSWAVPAVSLTALTGLAPQPWGGGAAQVRWGEGAQWTLVGYGAAPPDPAGASVKAQDQRAGARGARRDGRVDGAGDSGRAGHGAALPLSRGALGLGVRLHYGSWQGMGEASHGLPGGWAWHAGNEWQALPSLQLSMRWRGATARFRNPYQRGGLHAPWPVRAGTRAQAQLRLGAWRSSTRADVDWPRWRVTEGVSWAVTPREQLRLAGALRPGSALPKQGLPRVDSARGLESAGNGGGAMGTRGRAGAPGPLQGSIHALASSQRLPSLPCSLALRASSQNLRSTARLRWHLSARTALGVALTASAPLPRPAHLHGALALDAQHMWDRWDIVARAWSSHAIGWEHAAFLLVGARS